MPQMPFEDEGGDPPCWSHLFETGPEPPSNATLAQLVCDLADAVVISDAEGVVTFWNDAATRLFGWPASDAVGRPLELIIPERLRTRHQEGYQRVMETGHTQYGGRVLEVPALHRDGHTISIAFTVTLLPGPDGQGPLGVAAVIRDDSERWQQRRRARVDEHTALDRSATSDV